ncbi:unnamed protein product [Taenia asiatica]|uniref:FAM193_C domain-containing protein n=1 Tax=Taenia asiatica TaxID=60517 RepID=A0A158R8J6_TAEAS|nr:unnamed protein product [Taenia asiatica]
MISMPERMNYLQASIKNVLLELKLISATHLTMLNPELQHCLSNDAEILNSLEIVKPDAIDMSTYKIQDDLENNLVKYLDHFSFFIEILSTIKQQKLSESCAAGFEQLFFCRLCQSQNTSAQSYNQEVPQVINLIGSPCPHRCLNVIRGCYASLTGILPQLSQLSKDFIDLSRLLAQITSKPPDTGGAFLHNHFLDEMRAWSKKLQSLPPTQWASIREKVKQRCIGNPPVEVMDPASSEWKVEVAEFLWPATERALRTTTTTPPTENANQTAANMWLLPPPGGYESSGSGGRSDNDLRSEQQRSYLRMEQLIEQFMVPERLFGEHLGQPCLLGSKQNCWNGHKFEDEDEGLADFTSSGQLKNPAVKVTLAESDAAAARLGPKITARSQAIRALVHKIRRRSSGEIVEEGLPPPLPQIPGEEEEQSLSFHSLGPVIDIDEEAALPASYSEMEESSGLPFNYVDEWNSLLPHQESPKAEGDYTFGGADGRSKVIADLEEELDVTAIPTTARCRTGQPAAWLTFALMLITGEWALRCQYLQHTFRRLSKMRIVACTEPSLNHTTRIYASLSGPEARRRWFNRCLFSTFVLILGKVMLLSPTSPSLMCKGVANYASPEGFTVSFQKRRRENL